MGITSITLVFLLLPFVSGDIKNVHLMGNVTLECNHGIASPVFVLWYYNDKFDNGNRVNIVLQAGAGNAPTPGGNFTGRVSLDYSTGDVNLTMLECWEEQTYVCEADGSGVIRSHDVLLYGKLNPQTPFSFLNNYQWETQLSTSCSKLHCNTDLGFRIGSTQRLSRILSTVVIF